MRDEFEAKALNNEWGNLSIERRADGKYVSSHTEMAWIFYQAAWSAAQPRSAANPSSEEGYYLPKGHPDHPAQPRSAEQGGKYEMINKNSVMRFALKTIAEWPVSDIMHMDSMNMIKVAKDALACMPHQSPGSGSAAQPTTHQPDELTCLKAAEESLFHHGYNPATNRDVARICFNAMRGALMRESGSDAVVAWYPFDYLQSAIESMKTGEWSWCKNTDCKYIEARIDMRSGKFTLRGRHGNPITITELQFQHGANTLIEDEATK
jgi:hypothetical protein